MKPKGVDDLDFDLPSTAEGAGGSEAEGDVAILAENVERGEEFVKSAFPISLLGTEVLRGLEDTSRNPQRSERATQVSFMHVRVGRWTSALFQSENAGIIISAMMRDEEIEAPLPDLSFLLAAGKHNQQALHSAAVLEV
ncbi:MULTISPECIES: hypothetical protein [Leucobacter]|uniref:hypothetical protein n=1 Tax=Leucobacter TaxID=55968 RepID=UPI00115FD453|nr:hypothetical protein [Leucobacter chromiiresistens]